MQGSLIMQTCRTCRSCQTYQKIVPMVATVLLGLTVVGCGLSGQPESPDPARIVSLRKQYRMSQAVFAAVVNVSVKTVQSWEQGLRRPSDAALRMLQVIRREPDVVERILSSAWHPKRRKAVTRRGREDRPGRKITT